MKSGAIERPRWSVPNARGALTRNSAARPDWRLATARSDSSRSGQIRRCSVRNRHARSRSGGAARRGPESWWPSSAQLDATYCSPPSGTGSSSRAVPTKCTCCTTRVKAMMLVSLSHWGLPRGDCPRGECPREGRHGACRPSQRHRRHRWRLFRVYSMAICLNDRKHFSEVSMITVRHAARARNPPTWDGWTAATPSRSAIIMMPTNGLRPPEGHQRGSVRQARLGTQGHRTWKSLSYRSKGALEHKDSIGTGSVIRAGPCR